jgi:hypothetical protein
MWMTRMLSGSTLFMRGRGVCCVRRFREKGFPKQRKSPTPSRPANRPGGRHLTLGGGG